MAPIAEGDGGVEEVRAGQHNFASPTHSITINLNACMHTCMKEEGRV